MRIIQSLMKYFLTHALSTYSDLEFMLNVTRHQGSLAFLDRVRRITHEQEKMWIWKLVACLQCNDILTVWINKCKVTSLFPSLGCFLSSHWRNPKILRSMLSWKGIGKMPNKHAFFTLGYYVPLFAQHWWWYGAWRNKTHKNIPQSSPYRPHQHALLFLPFSA